MIQCIVKNNLTGFCTVYCHGFNISGPVQEDCLSIEAHAFMDRSFCVKVGETREGEYIYSVFMPPVELPY